MTRVALYQARSGIDPRANAEAVASAVREAADGGAAMLFTPEMSGLLDQDRRRAAGAIVTEEEDPTLAAVREAARAAGIWVHLGSLALDDGGGKWVNRGFVIDAGGEIRARYDKIHLFDVDLGGGDRWRESALYKGGTRAVVVPGTPVGTLGLTICYDLRFPALFAALAEAGAEVIAVPAAFTVPSGEAHWEVLLRARAIEAGIFIVAAAQEGQHEDGRSTYGHSMVVEPWGSVLAERETGRGLLFAEIERQRIGEVRAKIPALANRRTIAAIGD